MQRLDGVLNPVVAYCCWEWVYDDGHGNRSPMIRSFVKMINERACRADADRHKPDVTSFDGPNSPRVVLVIRKFSVAGVEIKE